LAIAHLELLAREWDAPFSNKDKWKIYLEGFGVGKALILRGEQKKNDSSSVVP
jgi:hypothetical protein